MFKVKRLILLGFVAVVFLFTAPQQTAGRWNGIWVATSPDPVSTCEAVGNMGTVCAEWTTVSGSPSFYQPCCIPPDSVNTSNLNACALLSPRLEEDF